MHLSRRRWVKLWTQELLYGTTSTELNLESQAIFVKFIALAGDSPVPGTICVAPDIAYTDKQLAQIFKCTVKQLQEAKSDCLKYDKIILNSDCISIKNWNKYQDARTDYQRDYMRDYRSKPNSKQTNNNNFSKLDSKHVTRTEQTIIREDHNITEDNNKQSTPIEGLSNNSSLSIYKEGEEINANKLRSLNTFKDWQDILHITKNKVGFLVNAFKHLHQEAPVEEFDNLGGRIAAILKKAGGDTGYVLKAIWDTSSVEISGFHLDYIQQKVQKSRKDGDKKKVREYTTGKYGGMVQS